MMHGMASFVDDGRWLTHKCYNIYSSVEMSMKRNDPAVIDAETKYSSRIAILSYTIFTHPLILDFD